MQIPFTKAHGAKNDFLLTWAWTVDEALDLPSVARAICERNVGIGADGWMLVDRRPGIRLFNADGSEPEFSGNGARCAAAFLILNGGDSREIEIATGAGPKRLRLISREGLRFEFEVNMGQPRVVELHFPLNTSTGALDATLIDCGNPQCAVVVGGFDFDWAATGADIESNPYFHNRTNVAFIRPIDSHNIEVRFFERGVGPTMSSGTGSAGAAVCAMSRGLAASPVIVQTPAGPLLVERKQEFLYLTGPAVITATGVFEYGDPL